MHFMVVMYKLVVVDPTICYLKSYWIVWLRYFRFLQELQRVLKFLLTSEVPFLETVDYKYVRI